MENHAESNYKREVLYISNDPCQWISDGEYESEDDKSYLGDIGEDSIEERYRGLEDSSYFQEILNGEHIEQE